MPRINKSRSYGYGFTLIEVLVVVAIIALLAAILIPSLSRARDKGRITVCLTNMSSWSKGVMMFSMDHKGYALIFIIANPGRDYQMPATAVQPGVTSIPQITGTTINYFEHQYGQMDSCTLSSDPSYYLDKFGRYEVLTCPSDKRLVTNIYSPRPCTIGIMSYGLSGDVFGITTPRWNNKGFVCWKNGGPIAGGNSVQRDWSQGGKRLAGKLDKIINPSEVALFSDAGNEECNISNDKEPYRPDSQLTTVPHPPIGINGPYLENVLRSWPAGFPLFRHSDRGGLCVALADGSSVFAQPIEWVNQYDLKVTGTERLYVQRFNQRIRVSPYKVGILPAKQP